LTDRPELGLKPIDMLLRVDHHVFQQVASGKVSNLGARDDGLAERLNIFTLEFQVNCKQILYRVPRAHLVKICDIRGTVQIQNVIDQA